MMSNVSQQHMDIRTARRTQTSNPLSTNTNGRQRCSSVRHTQTSLFIKSPWCMYMTFFLMLLGPAFTL